MKRIVFMGTPDFSIPAFRQLKANGYDIVAVYTSPDKPAGRGRLPSAPPVKIVANEHDIVAHQPDTLKKPLEVKRMTRLSPDIIVVVAYGQIIPAEILAIPRFGCLNIHPSLLPRYRGASPVASAILAGEVETGVTVMLLDTGIDTGPILAQKRVSIGREDTTESLEMKLAEAGARLLIRTLPDWFEQRVVPKRQNNREAVYTEQISKKDGEIDWSLSAETLHRQIRAYYPWPGCYTRWKGKMLKILEAFPLPQVQDTEPGLVVALPDEYGFQIGIGTGDGILGLIRVQIEGKKAMPVADFVKGQRIVKEKLG